MVQGFWDRQKWGPPFMPISSALSGHFCASLSQLGLPKNYISPSLSYRPSGLTENLNSKNVSRVFRYAQLPHEELCTENLTPFTKLLPCKKFSGLASLLKPQSLFKASYNALSIGSRKVFLDSNCKHASLELRQSLTYVFNRRHLFASTMEPWSLTGLLGGKISKACQVADRSEIIILKSQPDLDLNPQNEPSSLSSWDRGRVLAVYSPSHHYGNDLIIASLPASKKLHLATISQDSISIMKYATGKGDIDGGVKIELCNNLNFPVLAVLLDSASWQAEILFSSLLVTESADGSEFPMAVIPDKVMFTPSVHRKRMSLLELLLRLPARKCVTVSYAFKKILMHWNEYLPDANHGIYLPAASLIYQLSPEQLNRQRASSSPVTWEIALPLWASTYAEFLSSRNGTFPENRLGDGFVRLYSEAPLIRLPVPDFSMPFNALCLVCSVVALLFGAIHKLSTSPLLPVIAQGDEDEVDKPPIVRLVDRIKRILSTWRKVEKPKKD
nr:GPI transamidase component PIG T [Hymenolepis microstoma]